MPLSDDPWILEHSVIDPERLHALGMITLFWNQCERNLWHLFCLVFDFHPRVGWIIAHDMGDVAICERISPMANSPSSPPGVQREHPSKRWWRSKAIGGRSRTVLRPRKTSSGSITTRADPGMGGIATFPW